MKDRRLLWFLIVLAVAAGVTRLVLGSSYQTYQRALEDHKKVYRNIWEMVDELNVRREKLPMKSEQGVQVSLADRARLSYLGQITASPRNIPKKDYTDRTFTIKFERADPVFQRENLVNFLFNVELMLPPIRTTKFALQPAKEGSGRRKKAPPTGADRRDLWQVSDLVFTLRTPNLDAEKKK